MTHSSKAFFAVCTVLLLALHFAQAGVLPTSNNTNCRTWQPNTRQDVTIAGTLYLGSECNTGLVSVNLTFFCFPGASISIDHWTMRGGYLAIVGPPITDVAFIIAASSIQSMGGPAVGIVLGYGWSTAPTGTTPLWMASNVSLVATGSVLQSTAAVSASALGCTTLDTSSAANIDVAVTSVSLSAWNCSLNAAGTQSSAVVGVAVTTLSTVLVSRSLYDVSHSTAFASSQSSTQSITAATVGGVAIGQASEVQITNSTQRLMRSAVASMCTGSLYCASTIVGVAVIYVTNGVTVNNSNQLLLCSNATSNSSITKTNSYSVSNIAGVSVAYAATAELVVNNSTQFVSQSNATSTSLGSSYTASTVGGVVAATANALTGINCSQYVAGSVVNSNSQSIANGFSASSLGGIALANVGAMSVVNSSQLVSRSNATSGSNSLSYATSSVGGVSVAASASTCSVIGSIQNVSWSNASSSATSSASNSFSATSVAGITVASASGVVTIETSVLHVSRTNATSAASSVIYSASTLGGVSVAFAKAQVVVSFSAQYVLWCGVTSTSYSGSTSGYSSSNVGGIAVARTKAAVDVTNNTQIMVRTNANSNSSSNGYSTSDVGGIAQLSTLSAVTLTSTIISGSTVAACAYGSPSRTACGSLVSSLACCTNVTSWSIDVPLNVPQIEQSIPSDVCLHGDVSAIHVNHTWTLTRQLRVPVAPRTATRATLSIAKRQKPLARRTTTLRIRHRSGTRLHRIRNHTKTVSTRTSLTLTRQRYSKVIVKHNSARSKSAVADAMPFRLGTAAPETTDVFRGLDPLAARTVVVLGYSSSVIAGALSPTAANKPSVVAHAVDAASCVATTSFPTPDAWSLLPSVYSSSSDSSSNIIAGMLCSTITLAFLAFVWNIVVPPHNKLHV